VNDLGCAQFVAAVPREMGGGGGIDGAGRCGSFWRDSCSRCGPGWWATRCSRSFFAWNEFILRADVPRHRYRQVPTAAHLREVLLGSGTVGLGVDHGPLHPVTLPVLVFFLMLERHDQRPDGGAVKG